MNKVPSPPSGGSKRRASFLPAFGAGEVEDRPRPRALVSTPWALFALVLSAATLASALIVVGMDAAPEIARDFFREPTPHEDYRLGLTEAGLTESALGRAWVAAAEAAVKRPLEVDLPYQEAGFFPSEEPLALGYRFSLKRGQRLTVGVSLQGAADARLFVDVFRAAPDTVRAPVAVLSGEAGGEFVFEPRRSGDYLLRVQPELLRGGRFHVTIDNEASLEFPVAGRSTRSIGSFFGDPRDGGRREHHGVDVFAPRGTPILAVSEARVVRVDTTPIGGRVIWLRDERRNASVYYAHLHRILAREGTVVMPGDTLGTVGNTGNARTTPPHLHFGLYFRGEGPLDPWDYLYQPPGELEEVEVDLAALGQWARVRGTDIRLREYPNRRGAIMAELPLHTTVRVMGGVGSWYRVRLPDGGWGFVAARLTEGISEPLWLEKRAGAQALQAEPVPGAPVVDEVPEGAELPVLGTFGEFLYVRAPDGRQGWMASVSEEEDRM